MSKNRLLIINVLILLVGLFWITNANGTTKADPWPRWQKHDPNSLIVVDHVDWDLILTRYVSTNPPSGINRFQYSKVNEKDRLVLKGYLEMMQGVHVSNLNRSEQKAFWINLYNAKAVDLILDHYPVKSIRNIKFPETFSLDGPLDVKLLEIEGQKLSLNDIKNRILRPIWKDNRIHYAINSASMGGPNLQRMAYSIDNIEFTLEKAARDYINHTRGVSFSSYWLMVSSIYFWFQEDFGGSEENVINHLQKYLAPKKLDKLNSLRNKVIAHQYDWDLNE
ncbi:DUF547 domain-containing protein [Thermodesulfobacteriota bacterium]